MCFDDKRHVPQRKTATQSGRREAIEAAIARRNVPEWAWDGRSVIVESTNHSQLPPWERVRLDSSAYRHALENIVDALLRHYTPPRGRRLIVDSSAGIRVVETSWAGVVVEPYVDRVAKPRIGEADIAAQHYARRALASDETVDGDDDVSRLRVAMPEWLAPYYAEDRSAVPVEWRTPVDEVRTVVMNRRRLFEAGDVVLRSTDIDFVPLGLVAQTTTTTAARHHEVHVSLGRVHLDERGDYCTRTTTNAEARTEIFNMARLASVVRRLHASTEPACMTSIWSFVAFCVACGNDYTQRPTGLSHATMGAAYRQFVASGDDRRLVTAVVGNRQHPAARAPLVDSRAFERFLRLAYYTALAQRHRPVSWTDDVPTWAELAAAVRASTTNVARHMPSLEQLTRYFEQVAWSVMYASVASMGVEHVPEPVAMADDDAK